MNIADVLAGQKALGIGTPHFMDFDAPNTGLIDARSAFSRAQAQGKHCPVKVGTYLISNSITLTVPLWFFGGILKPASGVVITLNGPIMANPGAQIFNCSLGGTIAGNPQIEAVYPTWWGADPSFTLDSTAAMQAWLTFISGNVKPRGRQVPGRYKLIGTGTAPILTVNAGGGGFGMPMIEGIPRGTDIGTADYSLLWDASLSTQVVDANGNPPPILKMRGGSGQISSGGVRDICFIGNNQTSCVQVADACGLVLSNLRGNNCLYGVEIFNETAGGAPLANGSNVTGTGGASEFNEIRDCHFHPKLHGIVYRRFANAGLTTSATNSFHGCSVQRTWVNLPSGINGASAVFVQPGSKVYNTRFDLRVFFAAQTASVKQYVFGFGPVVSALMPAIPMQADGYVTTENGGGPQVGGTGYPAPAAFGGPNNTCYWLGSESSLGGMKYGTMIKMESVTGYGVETAANGTISGVRRPYSVGPRRIATGGTFGLTPGASLILMELQGAAGAAYLVRLAGIAWTNEFGGAGIWMPYPVGLTVNSIVNVTDPLTSVAGTAFGALTNAQHSAAGTAVGNLTGGWTINGGTGWGGPSIAVNAAAQLVFTNALWPVGGVDIWFAITPLFRSGQSTPAFNTMYD